MRLGEQHGARDALRLELMERVADDGESGVAGLPQGIRYEVLRYA
jgi:hypothetical protein